MLSLVSSIAIFIDFIRPSYDWAATSAAPPNDADKASVISANVLSLSITPLSEGSSFVNAAV